MKEGLSPDQKMMLLSLMGLEQAKLSGMPGSIVLWANLVAEMEVVVEDHKEWLPL